MGSKFSDQSVYTSGGSFLWKSRAQHVESPHAPATFRNWNHSCPSRDVGSRHTSQYGQNRYYSFSVVCKRNVVSHLGTSPQIPPLPTGLVQIEFSSAKTNKVQPGTEMTDFKLTGTFCCKENTRCPHWRPENHRPTQARGHSHVETQICYSMEPPTQ